jgi:MFS family permease
MIMQGGMVGRMVKLLGERRVVQLGFLTSLIGYTAIGFTQTVGQLLWVMAFSSICGAGLRPALTSMVTQKAGRREQGVILGLTQSLTSVAQIVAPILAGYMIDRGLLTTWAIWAGVLAGLAMFFQPRLTSTEPVLA